MDWNNPLRSIAATVDADVLQALGATQDAVTGNELAALAGRSYAQVYAVVRRMVAEGLVYTTRYGRTNTYRLNRDHVVAHGVLRILGTPVQIESEIRRSAMLWDPAPETVALLGPSAHGAASADEPIDLLIVRSEGHTEISSDWRRRVRDLTRRIEILSGNPVNLIDIDHGSLREGAGRHPNLVGLLRIGVRTIAGRRPSV